MTYFTVISVKKHKYLLNKTLYVAPFVLSFFINLNELTSQKSSWHLRWCSLHVLGNWGTREVRVWHAGCVTMRACSRASETGSSSLISQKLETVSFHCQVPSPELSHKITVREKTTLLTWRLWKALRCFALPQFPYNLSVHVMQCFTVIFRRFKLQCARKWSSKEQKEGCQNSSRSSACPWVPLPKCSACTALYF